MPRKKKTMGVGATVRILKRFVHPSEHIRKKYKNVKKDDRLVDCLVIKKEDRVVNRRQQECIVFRHDDFPNIELYGVERYCMIQTEGPVGGFFNVDIDDLIEQTFEELDNLNDEANPNDEETERIDNSRVGGEIDMLDVAAAGLVIDNDNDPLPENLIPITDDGEVQCSYQEWGHSGICHRRKETSTIVLPSMKLMNRREDSFNRLALFEHFFPIEYVKDVIIPNINKSIVGDRVTYGEFLRWLGIWFLIATVIGPSRESFFSNQPPDEFSEAPFRVSHYMSRKRFDKILSALRFAKSNPPTYIDRFWEVRELIDAWNRNMTRRFMPGWASCLDESMSPWTNKYTCPGHMIVPRKPWPLGNEYHSICCCTSGIMYAVELVEGKDRPKQKPPEKFSNVTKKGTTTSLLLRLCESIFHVGMVVILDSGFCVLRALIELKKRGVFASALIKKRKYWPAHVKGDEINKYFDDKEVGYTNSLPGEMDGIPFHIYGLKEPDYVMKLMSTYGTNERNTNHKTRRLYKNDNKEQVSTDFYYPEIMSNHFKFRHAVDDHNAKRHAPICLEHVWATKYWPHRPFSFLLAITEVNVNLAEAYFINKTNAMPQLQFRKLLAQDLINNHYLMREKSPQEVRKSKRKAALAVHCLVSLKPYRKFQGTRAVKSNSKYPQATCTMGHRKVRTYCACSPGILRCDQCFAMHCVEIEMTSTA